MDKFTVDLDQVLNDFEYSELTDQYSKTSTFKNEHQPQPASTSVPPISKHSINNVFHSLNEYLNTNINSLEPVDNNEKASESDKTEPQVKYVENNNENSVKSLETTSQLIDIYDESSKCSNSVVERDISENLTNFETAPQDYTNFTVFTPEPDKISLENRIEDDNGSVSSKDSDKEIKQNISLQDELLEADRDDKMVLNSKNTEEEEEEETHNFLQQDQVKNVIGFEDNLMLDEQELSKLLSELEEDDDLNFNHNKIEEEKNVQSTVESVPLSVDVTTENFDEIEQEENDQHNEDKMVEMNDESDVEEIEEVSEDDVHINKGEDEVSVQETDIEIVKELEVDRKKEEKEMEDDKELEITPEPVNEIKEEIEAKELTEESERNDKTVDNECRNIQDSTAIEESPVPIQKEISQESLPRPQNLPLNQESIEESRKIDLIGDPGSTPYNNIYINNEINQENNNNSDLDCSSTSSQTFSDGSSIASTASTEEIQDKNDVANIEDTKAELENSEDLNMEIPQESTSISDVVTQASTSSTERLSLGKEAPAWMPDSAAMSCLHCDSKFTLVKRRHHCRACGLVLCSKCCNLRFRLEYLDAEARVCNKCHDILNRETTSTSSSDLSPETGNSPNRRPNPNNPAEYCSTVSPLEQVGGNQFNPPPAVMVPVGVLKRKGSNKGKSNKSVMFCDGIRPGSDLTNLDNDFNYNNTVTKKLEKNNVSAGKNRNLPIIDSDTNTFIPKNEHFLPPTVTIVKTDIKYNECSNNLNTVNMLKTQQLTFAIHISLYVHVKIIDMSCCMNKHAWCFSTEGLINVGQDEVVYLLEHIKDEQVVPKDIFYHITNIYNEAVKGNSISEMGLTLHNSSNFLDSKNHAGFVYIRPTFQCLENVIKPKDPYIIGILVHRWETPWAKLFPIRLILRLGAEYRYYPSPIISTRHRDSVYVEIGHTIINILADFRNFSYTLPQIRGLTIHIEDKKTTVNIPINRYDQVIKSLNNSSDHILAFAGNFSLQADSHLVCIQDTQGNENSYSTHAINIQNEPRKVTGASFIVFNGALKQSSGLTAKSNIIEDGLMVQVLPEHLEQIRESLRSMKNHTISCGCINEETSDETVQILWGENDSNFNIGIVSTIDGMSLSGIPSIRVHNGKNYICHNGSRIIRWTEVFIIQNGEESSKSQEPVDISRVSESIARATCDALVKYIDLLITNNFQKIGIRVTLNVDNVSYSAGSNGTKLPPIYMKSLDNELIPVLHRIISNNFGDNSIVLELIFRILNV